MVFLYRTMFWALCMYMGDIGACLCMYESAEMFVDAVIRLRSINGKFSVLLFLTTKYRKWLICILFYWCTDYWQFSIMIIFIFSRSFGLTTTKLIFFSPVLFLKFLMSNLKGFFWWKCSRGFITINLFWGCV